MKRKSKHVSVKHLWYWSDAKASAPYLRSILGSLREHWLDARSAQVAFDRHNDDPSPRSTAKLIREKACQDDLASAQDRFDLALEELAAIDVFLLDPVNGLALMPFRKEDDLAWYYVDLFEPEIFAGWRYHDDPIEVCRPLDVAETAPQEQLANSAT